MKKFLITTTAILLLLFVSFWAYIQYQRSESYETHIHRDAGMLVRVDVYDIYKSLLSDYARIKKKKKESFLGGLGIPANIFVFNLKHKQASTFFMALPVEDPGELERSLKEHAAAWEPVADAPSGVRMQQSRDGKWTIAFNTSVIAMAYAPTREKTIDALADLVLKNNTLTVAQSPLSGIKEQEGHVTFTDGRSKGRLDFEKGTIAFTAFIPVEGWAINTKAQHRKPGDQSALFMWCYALPESLIRHKTFSAGPVSLQGDSLLAAGLKGFELEITDPVVQQDSVVTYDYNDDFEKVATVTIKENKVPGLYAFISADPGHLSHYLRESGVVNDSAAVNSSFFPLYKLYSMPQESGVLLSTLKDAGKEPASLTSPEFFNLYADFDRLQKQPELAMVQRYVQAFKLLDVRGTSPDGDQIQLKGKLQLKNKSTNALLQLLQVF